MGSPYKQPKSFGYGIVKSLSKLITKIKFKVKVRVNELKNVTSPYVIICNHECALDPLYLFSVNKNKHTFVISKSIYSTLPCKWLLESCAMINKQQFQTKTTDLMAMKKVITSGHHLVIFPAGLMPENGISTPIPQATYGFLKWLDADVYMARVTGSYFAMPKWSKVKRSGRTFLDVYKLFEREKLQETSEEIIKQKVDDALLFDAYYEQEHAKIKYKNANNVLGLENVVYACPICGKEYTIYCKDKHTLACSHCGYSETADKYGFLHVNGNQTEYRLISAWDYEIYKTLKEKVINDKNYSLSLETRIDTIDSKKRKFFESGKGVLTIDKTGFTLTGKLFDNDLNVAVPIASVPSLPSSPGKYIEIQNGDNIYRCVLNEGKFVVKILHLIKIFYELETGINIKYLPKQLITENNN